VQKQKEGVELFLWKGGGKSTGHVYFKKEDSTL